MPLIWEQHPSKTRYQKSEIFQNYFKGAMEKLGGSLIDKADKAYYGEAVNMNCIYQINKADRALPSNPG
jgi:hypothetical protein